MLLQRPHQLDDLLGGLVGSQTFRVSELDVLPAVSAHGIDCVDGPALGEFWRFARVCHTRYILTRNHECQLPSRLFALGRKADFR